MLLLLLGIAALPFLLLLHHGCPSIPRTCLPRPPLLRSSSPLLPPLLKLLLPPLLLVLPPPLLLLQHPALLLLPLTLLPCATLSLRCPCLGRSLLSCGPLGSGLLGSCPPTGLRLRSCLLLRLTPSGLLSLLPLSLLQEGVAESRGRGFEPCTAPPARLPQLPSPSVLHARLFAEKTQAL